MIKFRFSYWCWILKISILLNRNAYRKWIQLAGHGHFWYISCKMCFALRIPHVSRFSVLSTYSFGELGKAMFSKISIRAISISQEFSWDATNIGKGVRHCVLFKSKLHIITLYILGNIFIVHVNGVTLNLLLVIVEMVSARTPSLSQMKIQFMAVHLKYRLRVATGGVLLQVWWLSTHRLLTYGVCRAALTIIAPVGSMGLKVIVSYPKYQLKTCLVGCTVYFVVITRRSSVNEYVFSVYDDECHRELRPTVPSNSVRASNH